MIEIQAYSEQAARVLLVEGQDDAHVVKHLAEIHGGADSFRIVDKQGLPNLIKSIRVEFESEARQVIGIVVDADDDVSSRWSEIQTELKDLVRLPDISARGTIIEGINGEPRIGIWVMPNNMDQGELEDFVHKMIPQDDVIWPKSQQYIDELVSKIPKPPRPFTEKKVLRAKVHAWLATREAPRRMGHAIGRNDLDANARTATDFVAWLRRLFA